MCGICGYIDYSTTRSDLSILKDMVYSLNHRGPDDNGTEMYLNELAVIGLGHSRLSILDLSHAGHQPMEFGSLSIVLNGEIYNFKELRNELLKLGHTFTSESDTEVVLHAFSEWGPSCVSRFIGMFAFVVVNKKNLEVTIVRDRAGIKPLFYYWHDGLFLFASELKAFHKHPGFTKKIKRSAVRQFMDFGYVPSPNCIFENSSKLNPGNFLTFNITNKDLKITKYWEINDFYCLPSLKLSYIEAKEEVEKLLRSSFEYRMVSDVPVGVFLSGGYDSTAVTALLQQNRTNKLKTFTIGFKEGIDEAPFAREIAKYIGTEHTEYYCKTNEAQVLIPSLPFYYDEPFADSSAIPTILVSLMARKNVKVALSADGGDEIFAGYFNYRTFLNNLNLINAIPTFLRKIVGKLTYVGAYNMQESFLKHKFYVLSDILKLDDQIPQNLLRHYVTLDKSIKERLFRYEGIDQHTIYSDDYSHFKDNLSIALASDFKMYLQNDILAKVDRATMSVSLEGREPFLDHRLFEFVAQLPSDFKYGETQKMILKDIVHKYVPKSLMQRPKTGFSAPVFSWLKEDLSFLLEENLNSKNVAETDFFNTEFIISLKEKFLNGHLYDPTIIWKLLQFQMWYKMWIK